MGKIGDNSEVRVASTGLPQNGAVSGAKNPAATGNSEAPKTFILVDGNFEIARIRKNPSQDDSSSPVIDRAKKGTQLEKVGETKDGKWINVVSEHGKAGWIAVRLTKNIEQPKPEVVKAPETDEYLPPITAQTEDPEVVLDRALRSLFLTYDLSRKEYWNDYEAALKKIMEIIKRDGKISYKQLDAMTTFKRGLFGLDSLDVLKPDFHCLKEEYRNKGNEYFTFEVKKEEKKDLEEGAKKLFTSFLGWFGFTANAAEMLNTGEISREDAKKYLHMSDQLFDLIDQRMSIYGKGNGKLDVYEMSQFRLAIKKYCLAYPGITEKQAIDLYMKAKSFDMEDLDAVIDTARGLQSTGAIKENTSYGNLQKSMDPRLNDAVKHEFALLGGIKDDGVTEDKGVYTQGKGKPRIEADVNSNINNMCRLMAALPLISKLDAKDQKELFGMTGLPRFEGEMNKENILRYLFNEQVAMLIAARISGNAAPTAVALTKGDLKTWEDLQKLAAKMPKHAAGESDDDYSARIMKQFIAENPGITAEDVVKIQGKRKAAEDLSKVLADWPNLMAISASDIKTEPTTVEEWAKKDAAEQLLWPSQDSSGKPIPTRLMNAVKYTIEIDQKNKKRHINIGANKYDMETQLGEAFGAVLKAFEGKVMGRKGDAIKRVYDDEVKVALDKRTSKKGGPAPAGGPGNPKVDTKPDPAAVALVAKFNDKDTKPEDRIKIFNDLSDQLYKIKNKDLKLINPNTGAEISLEKLMGFYSDKDEVKRQLGLVLSEGPGPSAN